MSWCRRGVCSVRPGLRVRSYRPSRADVRAPAERVECHGVFQHVHRNPFPVRAAIDIGTGGVISLCMARVDAATSAMGQVIYQTQLPLHLQSTSPVGADPVEGGAGDSSSPHEVVPFAALHGAEPVPFTLSERSVHDITAKMRILHGAMRRNGSADGLSERAAVLMWPICLASNARAVAASLTREFGVVVRVLGQDFEVHIPWRTTACAAAAAAAAALDGSGSERQKGVGGRHRGGATGRTERRRTPLRRLLEQRHQTAASVPGAASAWPTTPSRSAVTAAGVRQLAFLAHAAMAPSVLPHRMLVVSEDPVAGLSITGAVCEDGRSGAQSPRHRDGSSDADHAAGRCGGAAAAADAAAAEVIVDDEASSPTTDQSVAGLQTCWLRGVSAAEAHRRCVVDIQHRPAARHGCAGFSAAAASASASRHAMPASMWSSPNPLLPHEYVALQSSLVDTIRSALPGWAKPSGTVGSVTRAHRSCRANYGSSEGVDRDDETSVVCTSFNGGVFNTAARVSQQTMISLDRLEVHARHHFCALTDALLAENFPHPATVLTNTALCGALMHALQTRRLIYLPEVVGTAAALLTQPSLWCYAARKGSAGVFGQGRLCRRDKDDSSSSSSSTRTADEHSDDKGDFYRSLHARSFARPHNRANPTAAPTANYS